MDSQYSSCAEIELVCCSFVGVLILLLWVSIRSCRVLPDQFDDTILASHNLYEIGERPGLLSDLLVSVESPCKADIQMKRDSMAV